MDVGRAKLKMNDQGQNRMYFLLREKVGSDLLLSVEEHMNTLGIGLNKLT